MTPFRLPIVLPLAALVAVGGCAEAERLAGQGVGDAAGRTAESRQTDYRTAQGQNVRFTLAGAAFADRVVRSDPRVSPRPSAYMTPDMALSWPDEEGYTLGHGGEIVLEFTDNTLEDGPGDDLAIFEFGPDVEAMFVEISEDGQRFVRVGRVAGASSTLDIAPAARRGAAYRFVRLIDDPDQGDRGGATPGADIDAVGAIHGQRR